MRTTGRTPADAGIAAARRDAARGLPPKKMTASDIEAALINLIDFISDGDDEMAGPLYNAAPVVSFRERGLLTQDRGIVITLEDGSEFQLTITQSRESQSPPDDELPEDAQYAPPGGIRFDASE